VTCRLFYKFHLWSLAVYHVSIPASQSRGTKWRIDLYEYGGVPLSVVASGQVVVIAGPISFTRRELSGTVWSDTWSGVR